ncbi:MAG: class I SAM-dependent methyltransferase [Flavobacteriales bacterium]
MHKEFEEDTATMDEAKEAAERLSFYPMMFQAAMAMNRLGVLQAVSDAGKAGVTSEALSRTCEVTQYGVETLLEAGLSLGLVKLTKPYTYRIAKMGAFWLKDRQTIANADFVHDVCYKGTFHLDEAIKTEGPSGLKELGNWPNIYHGLSQLPAQAKESWFKFDHLYSDQAFPYALNVVFDRKPKTMLDIGGNTGKWSLKCVKHDPDVHMTIVDLPGQCAMARERIEEAGMTERISTHEQNVLEAKYTLPKGVDAVWMSQFLDCFSPEQIVHILSHGKEALAPDGRLYIQETFWDQQDNTTATYCLHGTSLYFTALANGNSKMYDSNRMKQYVEEAGLVVENVVNKVGYFHSIMVCKLPG